MPMFPDSGVPAGDAKNTIDVNTVTPCDELWYSTSRCQPRFDPAAANAMLAEDMNLIMKGEVVYDCANLNNIERAVRYINQRGIPRGALLTGGPTAYMSALDPPVTRYNDFMTLTIIPVANNVGGGTTLDAGRGPAYILRNDGQHLRAGDLLSGRPAVIAFYQGFWWFVGLAASQVPIVVTGAIDFWIRTDGNDTTGDGTANSPDKAFRTIQGCWNAVGSRYAPTPLFTMNFRLGIPGDYAGAIIGPFGGNWSLTGDPGNAQAYRVHSINVFGDTWTSMWIAGTSSRLVGVTIVMDRPSSASVVGLAMPGGTTCRMINSRIAVEGGSHQSNGVAISVGSGGNFAIENGTFHLIGNNNGLFSFLSIANGFCQGTGTALMTDQGHYYFENCNFTKFLNAVGLSTLYFYASYLHPTNITGKQYEVSENSIINMHGQTCPGNVAGTASSGGLFIP